MTDTAGRNPPVMPPGRELDALVAEKVMGWSDIDGEPRERPRPSGIAPDGGTRYVPCYSTSWDAMRLVVERLVALWFFVQVNADKDGAQCVILDDPDEPCQLLAWSERAETVPHAVCLAALAALKTVEAQHGK